jgi:hypothetical protein
MQYARVTHPVTYALATAGWGSSRASSLAGWGASHSQLWEVQLRGRGRPAHPHMDMGCAARGAAMCHGCTSTSRRLCLGQDTDTQAASASHAHACNHEQ